MKHNLVVTHNSKHAKVKPAPSPYLQVPQPRTSQILA